jgi:hypothetical protein
VKVSNAGLCLCCHKRIEYGKANKRHEKNGDKWLNQLYEKWETPIKFSQWGRNLLYNGYGFTTLKPYLCETCQKQLKAFRAEFRKNLPPNPRKKPKNKNRLSAEDRKNLRALPYTEYLQTDWWKHVRAVALKTRGTKCERCGATHRQLHIHHKSYVHRGDELRHLDDLEVVCRLCHIDEHLIPVEALATC